MNTKEVRAVLCAAVSLCGLAILDRSLVAQENEREDQHKPCHGMSWSAPVNMGEPINSPDNDSHSWITKNGLSLYATTTRFSHSVRDEDIAVSQRRSLHDPWSEPVRLGPNVNTIGYNDSVPSISEDGLDLYFHSPRPGGCGAADIYVSHRIDPTDDFGWQPAVNLGCVVNSPGPDNGPDFFRAEGTDYLYYLQTKPPGGIGTLPNIVVSTRPTGTGDFDWGSPVPVNALNSEYVQGRMSIRRTDGLEILFTSTRPGLIGDTTSDIWVSTRESLWSPWSPPANLGPPISIPGYDDGSPHLDFDGTTLYFFSTRPGGFGGRDLYTSTRCFCDDPDNSRSEDGNHSCKEN
jgi:WD40-like Beta Propeller Repeat